MYDTKKKHVKFLFVLCNYELRGIESYVLENLRVIVEIPFRLLLREAARAILRAELALIEGTDEKE